MGTRRLRWMQRQHGLTMTIHDLDQHPSARHSGAERSGGNVIDRPLAGAAALAGMGEFQPMITDTTRIVRRDVATPGAPRVSRLRRVFRTLALACAIATDAEGHA